MPNSECEAKETMGTQGLSSQDFRSVEKVQVARVGVGDEEHDEDSFTHETVGEKNRCQQTCSNRVRFEHVSAPQTVSQQDQNEGRDKYDQSSVSHGIQEWLPRGSSDHPVREDEATTTR